MPAIGDHRAGREAGRRAVAGKGTCRTFRQFQPPGLQVGQDYFLAVGEGMIEVTADHVALLTDMAIAAEHIDEAKAEEARRRAEARLQEKLSDEEVASVNSALAHSLAQLHVKRRHRG